jgi:hypothetical protein
MTFAIVCCSKTAICFSSRKTKSVFSGHLRPERPAHLHPEMLHPALREKGRAIPQRPITVASATGMDGSVPRVS